MASIWQTSLDGKKRGGKGDRGNNPSTVYVVDEAGGTISVLWEKLGHQKWRALFKTPWWLAKPKLPIITSSVPGLYNLILESSSFPSRTQGYLSPLELVFTESLGPTDPERCSGPQERTQSSLEEVSRKAWIHAVWTDPGPEIYQEPSSSGQWNWPDPIHQPWRVSSYAEYALWGPPVALVPGKSMTQ